MCFWLSPIRHYYRHRSLCLMPRLSCLSTSSNKPMFQWSPNWCQEIYIISNQQCVMHTRCLEILSCSHLLSCKHKHLRFPWWNQTTFDHFIRTKIPTPLCLPQSILGSLKFAHLLASSGLAKLPWTVSYIQPWFYGSILWKSFWRPSIISHNWNM